MSKELDNLDLAIYLAMALVFISVINVGLVCSGLRTVSPPPTAAEIVTLAEHYWLSCPSTVETTPTTPPEPMRPHTSVFRAGFRESAVFWGKQSALDD